MPRIHAFELEDQTWMPSVIREAGMAYLRFVAEKLGVAEHIRPIVDAALERSGEREIVDLCSGGGGPMLSIAESLQHNGSGVHVTMTDLYPDPGGMQLANDRGGPGLRYDGEPLDASNIPSDRTGLRTLFNAFHHLRPELAQGVLASAVKGRRPIAVVEVLQRKPLAVLGILFTPIVSLFVVPFLRPFRLAWIPLTYLLPVIPFFILWDGIVSCLRIYDEQELLALASAADPDDTFDWEVQIIPMDPAPVPGIALVGIPRAAS